MSIDLAALRAEIDADPAALGLAALLAAGEDSRIASALNAPSGKPVPARVAFSDLMLLIDPGEAPLPNSPGRSYLDLMGLVRTPLLLTVAALESLGKVFPATGVTMSAIRAIAERPGSRAEEVWGAETVISADDVSACFAADREAAYQLAQAPLTALKDALDGAVRDYRSAASPTTEAALRAAQAAVRKNYVDDGVVFAAGEVAGSLTLGAVTFEA